MSRSRWQRFPAEAEKLFGVELSDERLARLAAFLDLIELWSAKMNLVGRASRNELVDRHLLDSFGPAPLFGDSQVVADYGSGAGFPGIPLAVARPQVAFYLIESRRKRCSFLREVVRKLGLSNVIVVEGRGEEWDPPREIDVVIGRALATATLSTLATAALGASGRLVVMRKQGTDERFEGFAEAARVRYSLPGGEQHEAVAYDRIA